MTLIMRRAALGLAAVLIGLLATITSSPAEAATKSCSVSTRVWTNSDDEIINDASVTCRGVTKVKIVSELYYCTWYKGDKASYELQDRKTKTYKLKASKTYHKKVTVVEKAMNGKWIGNSRIYYKVGKTPYSKGESKFANVGSSSTDSSC